MNSTVRKHSIVIGDHRTSVSLEDAFWKALKQIATHRRMTLSELVTEIDAQRGPGNLSSRLRLHVLNFYRDQLIRAGGVGIAPDEKTKARRQIARSPLRVNLGDKFRQGHAAMDGDLLEGLPERILQTDAGPVIADHDRVLTNG